MRKGPNSGFASEACIATLALYLLSGNALAAASCAGPQEMGALQTAALQQQLMVAAFSCGDAASYNRFVTTYQNELQVSDQALMDFFLRHNTRKDGAEYDAYKTWLANTSSLRSVRDRQFCRSAKAVFDVAFQHKGSLAELVSQRPSLIRTGYTSCAPDRQEFTQMADATPSLPARHSAPADNRPSDLAPNLTSRLARALPMVSPEHSDAAIMPPREDPRAGRSQARVTYARDADPRNADNWGAGDPETSEYVDSGRDSMEARDNAGFGGYTLRHAPAYAQTASEPPHAYDHTNDRSGDNTGENYEDRDGNNDRPTANNVSRDYRDDYDAPYADAPYNDGSPARPRFIRGPDGRWYELHYHR